MAARTRGCCARRRACATLVRFSRGRAWRLSCVANTYDPDTKLPLCPITASVLPPCARVELVSVGSIVMYHPPALYKWFTSSFDFRCPVTRRLLLKTEVRRCARMMNSDNAIIRRDLADFASALYDSRHLHVASRENSEGDAAAHLVHLDAAFTDALQCLSDGESHTVCGTAFFEWTQAFHGLRRHDVLMAQVAVMTAMAGFLTQFETNRRRHNDLYGTRSHAIVFVAFQAMVEFVVATGGRPSADIFRGVTLLSVAAAAETSRILAYRMSGRTIPARRRMMHSPGRRVRMRVWAPSPGGTVSIVSDSSSSSESESSDSDVDDEAGVPSAYQTVPLEDQRQLRLAPS